MSDIKKTRPHITIEQLPNPTVRSYIFRPEIGLTKGFVEFGKVPPQDKRGLTHEVCELGERLAHIPGVIKVYFLKESEVQIIIADAFSWEDVGPRVLGELIEALFPEVIGKTIYVSTAVIILTCGDHEQRPVVHQTGHHKSRNTRRQEMATDQPFEVIHEAINFPILDVEHLLSKEAIEKAKSLAKHTTQTTY